jgi:hypothetical protein
LGEQNPEDAKTVVILGQAAAAQAEVDLIKQYLQSGGAVIAVEPVR